MFYVFFLFFFPDFLSLIGDFTLLPFPFQFFFLLPISNFDMCSLCVFQNPRHCLCFCVFCVSFSGFRTLRPRVLLLCFYFLCLCLMCFCVFSSGPMTHHTCVLCVLGFFFIRY